MADKVSKGRQAKGESIAQSKLTEEDVIAIRASNGISQASIAEQFGVSHDLIALVRSRKIWRHV
jgi:DNA-binding transcriptional regulator YiaG